MARSYNGSTQGVTFSPGAFASTPFTYGMIAGIVRSSSTGSWRNVLTVNVAADIAFTIDSSNLAFYGSGGAAATGMTLTQTTWLFYAVTKATGSAVPRFHVYDYTAGTWTHTAGSAALNDSAVNVTDFRNANWGGVDWWPGDMAAVGVFRTLVPSDAELEAMGLHLSRLPWLAAAARSDKATVWLFDQAATTTPVLDLTGGGANESGGTVPGISANVAPLFSYGASVIGAPTAAASATVVVPTAALTLSAQSLSAGRVVTATSVALTASAFLGHGGTGVAASFAHVANNLVASISSSLAQASVGLTASVIGHGSTSSAAAVALVASNLAAGTSAVAAVAAVALSASPFGSSHGNIVAVFSLTAYGLTVATNIVAGVAAIAIAVQQIGQSRTLQIGSIARLLDEDGNPILDENGDYILDEQSPDSAIGLAAYGFAHGVTFGQPTVVYTAYNLSNPASQSATLDDAALLIAAFGLTGQVRTLDDAALTLAAFALSSYRTLQQASLVFVANNLSAAISSSLTSATVSLTASALKASISSVLSSPSVVLTANLFGSQRTIGQSSVVLSANDLATSIGASVGIPSIALVANNFISFIGSVVQQTTIGYVAYGLTHGGSIGQASFVVSASGLQHGSTFTVPNVSLTANNLSPNIKANTGQANVSFIANNLINSTSGFLPIGTALIGVAAYQITALISASLGLANVSLVAGPFRGSNGSGGSTPGVGTNAYGFTSGIAPSAVTPLVSLTASSISALMTPNLSNGLVENVAYGLDSGPGTLVSDIELNFDAFDFKARLETVYSQGSVLTTAFNLVGLGVDTIPLIKYTISGVVDNSSINSIIKNSSIHSTIKNTTIGGLINESSL